MTLFEYIAVAASLLSSFVAVRLLGGLAAAFQPDSRYWVHAGWVCLSIFLITLNWWIFWSYREVDWNYALFVLAHLPLALLYLLATVLVPAESSQVLSWRDHYFTVRRRFFALNIAYIGSAFLCTVILLGHPVLHPRRVLIVVIVAMFTAGLMKESPRLQVAILLVFAATQIVAAALWLRPGSFGVVP